MATGGAPLASTSVANLPKPQAPLEVTVGGIRADVTFFVAFLQPILVGAIQVNYRIPPRAHR